MKRRGAFFLQKYGIPPYRQGRQRGITDARAVSPKGSRRRSPRDFTSAAIRRDSQYTFSYGEIHSTAQMYKVCGVCWMEHGWSILSAHAPLKRVLGGGRGRLQQNSKAAFSCSISKLHFSGHVFLGGYGVSSINLNITPPRKHSGHAIPIWIPIFWSRVPVSQKRDMTRDTSFQSRRFDSDLKQHLSHCYSIIKASDILCSVTFKRN